METSLTLLCTALGGVLILVKSKGRVRPFWVTYAALTLTVLGYQTLDSQLGTSVAPLFAGSVLAMSVGYALAVRGDQAGAAVTNAERHEVRVTTRAALGQVTAVVTILVVYHFAAVGLPALGGEVALERWSFTDSGLFGVPGRAFLYGLPLCAVASVVLYARSSTSRSARRILLASCAAFVASRLVSGFRGALVQSLVIIGIALLSQRIVRLGAAARTWAAPVFLAFLFAVVMGMRYDSVRTDVEAGSNPLSIVFQRSTEGAAHAGHYVLRSPASLDGAPRFALTHDAALLSRKYLHMTNASSRRDYPFNYYVSVGISGRELGGDRFIVPVTVGLYPLLAHDFGAIVGLMMSVGFGYLFGHTELRALRARSLVRAFVSTVGLIVMHYIVIKGSVAHLLLNWGPMCGAVLVAGGLLQSIARGLVAHRPAVGAGEVG